MRKTADHAEVFGTPNRIPAGRPCPVPAVSLLSLRSAAASEKAEITTNHSFTAIASGMGRLRK